MNLIFFTLSRIITILTKNLQKKMNYIFLNIFYLING